MLNHNPGARPHRARAGLLVCSVFTLLLASGYAAAEDKGAREREALRRAQQSLRQTQEERDALASEKASLTQAKDKAESSLKQSDARIRSAENQARSNKARLEQAEANLKGKEEALLASQQREEVMQAQVQKLQAELNDKTRTLSSVSGLLSESTKENAGLKAQNKTLYSLGLSLVDVVRAQSPSAWLRTHDALLGFKGVEAENLAEKFRTLLDDARYNAPTVATNAAP